MMSPATLFGNELFLDFFSKLSSAQGHLRTNHTFTVTLYHPEKTSHFKFSGRYSGAVPLYGIGCVHHEHSTVFAVSMATRAVPVLVIL